jgi:hypothetical protein
MKAKQWRILNINRRRIGVAWRNPESVKIIEEGSRKRGENVAYGSVASACSLAAWRHHQ